MTRAEPVGTPVWPDPEGGPLADAERIGVYLNNAATSWPKPEPVVRAMDACMRGAGSAMRQAGGEGARVMNACRDRLAELLDAPEPGRFVLLPGCTYALNLALFGLPWREGDGVVISGLEHHAVSRPARKLAARRGVRLGIAPYAPGRPFDLDWLETTLRAGGVRLVAVTAASNITGEVLPVREIVGLAHEHGALALVDAAQAAGLMPLSIREIGCDMLAFAGHKGLLGPLGVGGLWLRPGLTLDTLAEGGTGGDSGKHELSGSCPSTYEVGSHNLPAIAGLEAGVRWLLDLGVDTVRRHEHALASRLRNGLRAAPGLTFLGGEPEHGRTGVVSFTVDGVEPRTFADRLAAERGVASRAGFHCAPLAHETLGTIDRGGCVRLSVGFFNTESDVDEGVAAVRAVAGAPA